MNYLNKIKSKILPLLFFISLIQTGCKSNENNNNNNNGTNGSLVHQYSDKIYVTNLATKKQFTFDAVPYSEGGVSVSTNGTIAQLQQRDLNPEGVYIRLTKLDGTFIDEYTIREDFSFVTSGIRISPNAKKVAFSLQVQLNSGSTLITYILDVATRNFITFQDLNWAGWTSDNRLVGFDPVKKQIMISNAVVDYINPVGSNNLEEIEALEGTPDGSSVVFSNKTGIRRIFSMNISNGSIMQLLSDGTGQFYPVPANGSLFYVQECCSLGSTSPVIHRVALSLNSTISSPIKTYNLENSQGQSLSRTGRFGYTPATL
jgi:hypothetical protein